MQPSDNDQLAQSRNNPEIENQNPSELLPSTVIFDFKHSGASILKSDFDPYLESIENALKAGHKVIVMVEKGWFKDSPFEKIIGDFTKGLPSDLTANLKFKSDYTQLHLTEKFAFVRGNPIDDNDSKKLNSKIKIVEGLEVDKKNKNTSVDSKHYFAPSKDEAFSNIEPAGDVTTLSSHVNNYKMPSNLENTVVISLSKSDIRRKKKELVELKETIGDLINKGYNVILHSEENNKDSLRHLLIKGLGKGENALTREQRDQVTLLDENSAKDNNIPKATYLVSMDSKSKLRDFSNDNTFVLSQNNLKTINGLAHTQEVELYNASKVQNSSKDSEQNPKVKEAEPKTILGRIGKYYQENVIAPVRTYYKENYRNTLKYSERDSERNMGNDYKLGKKVYRAFSLMGMGLNFLARSVAAPLDAIKNGADYLYRKACEKTKEYGFPASLAFGALAVASLPLKLIGSASGIASEGLKRTGTLMQEAGNFVGSVTRAVVSPFHTVHWKGVGASFTRLVADTLHVATGIVGETGKQISEITSTPGIPGVSKVGEVVGNAIQSGSIATDTGIQTARNVLVGQVSTAKEVFELGQSTAKSVFESSKLVQSAQEKSQALSVQSTGVPSNAEPSRREVSKDNMRKFDEAMQMAKSGAKIPHGKFTEQVLGNSGVQNTRGTDQ